MEDKGKVLICGLWLEDYRGDYNGIPYVILEPELREHGELWVINDWYAHTPQITNPDRIWNLHDMENVDCGQLKGRYPGDWQAVYNSRKCPVMVVESHNIKGLDNPQLLDEKELLKYPVKALSCSISTMMLTAMIEGYTEVSVIGVRLNEEEYGYQAQGLFNAKEILENNGVKVNMLPEGRFEELKERETAVVDWANIQDLKPYWAKGYNKVCVSK